MNAVKILQQFFGSVRPITIDEFKALSKDEREELASLAAPELGVTFEKAA